MPKTSYTYQFDLTPYYDAVKLAPGVKARRFTGTSVRSVDVAPTARHAFLGQGGSTTPLACVSQEAVLDHLRRVLISEGNEDMQSPAGRGRSAAGSVRPVRITAARGLGENVPRAASCPSPRMLS